MNMLNTKSKRNLRTKSDDLILYLISINFELFSKKNLLNIIQMSIELNFKVDRPIRHVKRLRVKK